MKERERFTNDTREKSGRSEGYTWRSGGHPKESWGGIGRLTIGEADRFMEDMWRYIHGDLEKTKRS
jgi:hypothetical protein